MFNYSSKSRIFKNLQIFTKKIHFTKPRYSKSSKGYSIVEVAVALAVFSLIAGMVTVAIARAQFSAATIRFEREAREVVSSLVLQASTNNYRDIVEGTFKRPSPCLNSFTNSCINIQGREIVVQWFTDIGEEEVPVGQLPSKATLRAVAELPQGSFVNSGKTVLLPKGLDQRESVLNVTLTGASYGGEIYLISASGKQLSVGTPISNVVTLRTTADSCTLSKPCYLALTGSGDTYTGDPLGLGTLTLSSENSRYIILKGGVESSVTVTLAQISYLELDLIANNPGGYEGSPAELGSVCLWVSFNDGETDRDEGYCNTEVPGKIFIKNYKGNNNEYKGFSAGQTVTLRVDSVNGTCPTLKGGKAYTGKGWVTGGVCTSYTWGVPLLLEGPGGSTSFNGSNIALVAGKNQYSVIWEGSGARPATGYLNEDTWDWPRASGTCYLNDSCKPSYTTPETTQCPNKHCYFIGKNPPVLYSPQTVPGVYSVQVNSGSTSNFTLDWIDSDNKPNKIVQGTLIKNANEGVLTNAGKVFQEGDVVFSQYGATGSYSMSYSPTTFSGLDYFTIRLQDETGAYADYKVALYNGNRPWLVNYTPSIISQGATALLDIEIIGTDGVPVQGVDLILTKKPKKSEYSEIKTNASGNALLPFYVNDTKTGKHTLTLQGSKNGFTTTQDVEIYVQPSVASVSVTSVTVGQGSTGSVKVKALDYNNNTMENALVAVNLTTGPGGEGVVIRPSACLTNESGNCNVSVYASSSATAGVYEIQAVSNGKTSTGKVTVSGNGVIILADEVNVALGGETTMKISLRTSGGGAIPGANIVAVGPPGVGFTSIPPTNATGQTEITVVASNNATPGESVIDLSYEGSTSSIQLNIISQASYVNINPSEVFLPQGAEKLVEVTAYDIKGKPVPGLDLTIQSGDLIVTKNGKTNSSGEMSFVLKAPQSAGLGERFVSVFSNGKLLDSLSAQVVPKLGLVTMLDSLTKNTTQKVRVSFKDISGKPLVNTKTGLESLSPGVIVNSTALTDNNGVATFEVTVRDNAKSGYLNFNVYYAGEVKKIGGVLK